MASYFELRTVHLFVASVSIQAEQGAPSNRNQRHHQSPKNHSGWRSGFKTAGGRGRTKGHSGWNTTSRDNWRGAFSWRRTTAVSQHYSSSPQHLGIALIASIISSFSNKTKAFDILRRNESRPKEYPLEIALHEAISLKKSTNAIYKL